MTPREQRVLLFVPQLPQRSSSVLRGRVRRRLEDLLAIPLTRDVYVMTDSPNARRELQAMAAEVQTGGGHASVFSAVNLNRPSGTSIHATTSNEESPAPFRNDQDGVD